MKRRRLVYSPAFLLQTKTMINGNKFDIYKLKGKLAEIRDWMRIHHIPPRLLFFILGAISTIWFLIRVIPKPSRAGYPCMKVAAPFMSGLIVYLLAVAGITAASVKAKRKLFNVRYLSTGLLGFVVIVTLAITPSQNTITSYQDKTKKSGPDDGPNQPIGNGMGINPGRVIWAWDPKATNADCINAFDLFKPENTNQSVVNRMVADAVKKLSGKTTLSESWDALFHYFNDKKSKTNKGYTPGENIFIKINQGTANWILPQDDKNNGYYYPISMTAGEEAKKGNAGTCETNPHIVLELLRELVNVMGIDQTNIAIGDPISHIFGHNYEAWVTEFPDVVYVDKSSTSHGRTLINPTSKDLIFYSDKTQNDKLYEIVENADYLINVANLKPHGRGGISLTAKNHFGSQARAGAGHLHYSLVSPVTLGNPTNAGYHKYRVLVDLMGSRYLGQNTLLYVVDGLYGGGSNETLGPVKYFMAPFNNDWSNSIFLSQDQVALESVCYDFLRTEWNGRYKHNPSNNEYETIPNVNGVDDYLHQAADPSNWPKGISYDPDNSGRPLSSLGIHEHWNDPVKKQYSRNLGYSYGIDFISIPDTLVKTEGSGVSSKTSGQKESQGDSQGPVKIIPTSETKTTPPSPEKAGIADTNEVKIISVVNRSFDEGFQAKTFYSAIVDDDNTIWFLTEAGIVSFDGNKWSLHNKNRKVPTEHLKDFAYYFSTYGPEIWIATPQGVTVATLPIDARTGATTYHTENTTILSDNVLSVVIGKSSLRWFGTDKGISAFLNKKWLTCSYQRKYPESMFRDFPITVMATSPGGDSLYVATEGAGVARVFRNEVDAISGASEYAQWGPIQMPSDKVYSICITPDGTQWIGTDRGVTKHTGNKTLENWTVFNTGNGLINNFVQAIAVDKKGKLWFGTKGGASVFDGSVWTSFTRNDGLNSNDILCITVDRNGLVWLGTDNGVICYSNGGFIIYQ